MKALTKVTGAIAQLLLVIGVVAGYSTTATPEPAAAPTHTTKVTKAQIEAWANEMVAEQVAALGCSTTPAMTPHAAVRPAGVTADGVFDSGVVTVVPLSEAFAAAQAGKVFVVGWCA